MLLINTLDGIKRQSTVNLFNLLTRIGKLTETERSLGPDSITDQSKNLNPFREIKSLGEFDYKQLVY